MPERFGGVQQGVVPGQRVLANAGLGELENVLVPVADRGGRQPADARSADDAGVLWW